jgi:hypothetical protein
VTDEERQRLLTFVVVGGGPTGVQFFSLFSFLLLFFSLAADQQVCSFQESLNPKP